MPEKIEISVIPQDLRHEETIVQIAEALDNLDFAVSHIFNSINERIGENVKRLGTIKTRATKLQGQLDYLQNNLSLKAVKMYSAAKYPANHVYKDYKMAIHPKCRIEIPTDTIYKSPVPISDKTDPSLIGNTKIDNGQYSNNLNLQEKLQFYYVKPKPVKKTKSNEIGREKTTQNVSSIDSLLLFNNKDSKSLVNVQNVQSEEKSRIEDAPDSISQPWHSSEMESPSTYLYAPTLGEVPQMNVPLTLPDLPGIVDDERFSLDLNFASPIAPSSAVATPVASKDPPSLDHQNKLQETTKPSPQAEKISENPKSSNISNAEPLKTEAKLETKSSSEVPSQLSLPPPPPPPPPPPSSPPEEQEIKKPTKKPSPVKPAAAADDRSSLMAAIRDAGGLGKAKLRHAAPADKEKDRWSSASVGGDLMADLHATLSLRRKGIAGPTANTFARLSSMIPPPPKPNESSISDKNSATSESQDDDGWEE